MSTISVPKEKIERGKGVVILPVREYQKLLEQAMPAYRLTGADAKRLDRLVAAGIKEHGRKRTKLISSLADLN